MVKRIVWTSRAYAIFSQILEYYAIRNQSKVYSRKLHLEIQQMIDLIAKFPWMGMKTSFKGIHVLIKGHYKIYYAITADEIIIHLVWDTRQNPKSLKL
mgnify:CR=1 FL=1